MGLKQPNYGSLKAVLAKRQELRRSRGSIAEVPLALYCFLIVIVFPLIDMLGVGTGATIVYLSANESATRAANQRRYADSLSDMLQTVQSFTNNGFANFARMQPIGGYEASGADLYIDANNTKSNSVQSFGPNSPITAPIDQSTYVYEARVNTSFQVGPIINLGFMPFLSSVQGLGTPAVINFSVSKQVEFAGGLKIASAPTGGGPWPSFSTAGSPNEASSDGGSFSSGWNLPTIYSAIASAGQTVVSESVIQILATNPNPTNTGLSVAAGQNLWLDSRANGLWSTGSLTLWDADGAPPALQTANFVIEPAAAVNLTQGSLIGKLGTNPYFEIGKTFQNYAPNQTGEFTLVINDNIYLPNSTVWGSGYSDNLGSQIVRVVIAAPN